MPIFDREGYLWYGALDGLTRERLPQTGTLRYRQRQDAELYCSARLLDGV